MDTPVPAVRRVLAALRGFRPTLGGLGYGVGSRWDRTEGTGDPTEHQLAEAMPKRRRVDFIAGRWALRRALTQARLPALAPIVTGERGEPKLPPGVVGSISHSHGIAVALAGAASQFSAVGIDLELSGLPTAAAHLVLTEPERSWLAASRSSGERDYRLLCAFSAKEAAYKALDPVLRTETVLRHIHLLPDGAEFLAWPRGRADLRLRVRVHPVGTGVLAWIAVPAPGSPVA